MGFHVEAKLILVLFTATLSLSFVGGEPQVPCYFIFGDSLMDNGNNNDLVTQAKAIFPPYGIDYPDGPTGRFSNGRNTADVLAQLLGFESSIPPFATAKGDEIIQGVNYASGAAGILDETAEHMGGRISMNQQLRNHATTILRLVLIQKGNIFRVQRQLKQCIYTVTMGNNDYINNYFYPQYYNTSKLYTPEEYAEVLVEQYSKQLRKLYNYGARKIAVSAAGYSGCAPAMIARFGTTACVDEVNGAVIQFNIRLATALAELESKLSGSKFIFIDAPLGYSNDQFNVSDTPCCIVSTTIGEGQCLPNQIPCSARQNYVFWDGFHPTESVSLVDGARIYDVISPLYASQEETQEIMLPKYVSDVL